MKPSKILLTVLLSSFSLVGLAADTYEIDPVHSSVGFGIMHFGVTNFYGRFNDVSGTVTIDKEDPSKSSIQITVPVGSLDTHNAKRDQHLKSPDFFNAKQFPVMTFKSKSIEAAGNDTYKVTGDLSLHGVTKPLTVEFKKGEGKGPQGELRAGGEARVTIKRSDFGMNFMQGPLGDDVAIVLSLEGVKK